MNHAVLVRVVQRGGRLAGDPERVFHRQLLVAPEPVPQALPLDVGHREPELARDFARVEHGEDVGVLESGRDLDLAMEPVAAE